MRNWLWILLVALLGLVALACGGNGSDGNGFSSGGTGGTAGTGGVTLTCDTLPDPPLDCGKTCASDSQCEASFCNNGVCVANCATDADCGPNASCNVRGRCVPTVVTGGTGGTGNTGVCRDVEVTPSRSIPNVMFHVDQSGSMTDSFGTENRWEAANTVINGIVSSTDSIVRYGLTTYTSDDGDLNPPCPRLPTQIDFALDNASNIGNDTLYPYRYPNNAGADTPTGDSIEAVVDSITMSPPPAEGPTVIVLATDGAPDSCEYPDPNTTETRRQARDEAVDAAAFAHGSGIDLFVLWVGTLTSDSVRNHIQEVANEGVGLPRNGSSGDAEFWVGTDPTSLENEFRAIISASISCDIAIDKPFVDEQKQKACDEGDVRLAGQPLACSDSNGWRVKPGADNVIELVGPACDTFKGGDVTFTATFPCGTIVVE